MNHICLVVPVLPGRTADARDFMRELEASRNADYQASEQRIGIVKEAWYLARTPAGDHPGRPGGAPAHYQGRPPPGGSPLGAPRGRPAASRPGKGRDAGVSGAGLSPHFEMSGWGAWPFTVRRFCAAGPVRASRLIVPGWTSALLISMTGLLTDLNQQA